MSLPRPKLVGLDRVPGASASIRRARAWGGLLGFAAAFLAASLSGAGLGPACGRGLVAGVVSYLVFWAAAIWAWRALIVAEARRAVSRARGRGRS